MTAGSGFEVSSLWLTAFGERQNDKHAASRVTLREKYIDLRKKVVSLVAQIPKDIPGLTVHDVTHLDALWEMASLIAGEEYSLNAAEGYVFGAAILLHDTGMSFATYPNGLDDLKQTNEWKDSVAAHLRQHGNEKITPQLIENPPAEIQALALPEVLRTLHAKKANELPFLEWDSGGEPEYLIDDPELRNFYGPLIGRIAYSHHASAGQLPVLLGNVVGAHIDLPSDWSVDPIKVACLLRTADAAHIDERRAPRFLKRILTLSGLSEQHWNFQSKLAKPRLEADSLIYTSGPEFGLKDADAWWLCFDTIKMIDRELTDADILLDNMHRKRFAGRRVRGSESSHALAAFIRTRDWEPIDTALKVSDVPRLVKLLGGEQLYGRDFRVPIREILQNAADAIRARRLMANLDHEYGKIKVFLSEDQGVFWLHIEDDGIGMSERTLTNSLLDFGKSFWASDAVKEEFPGLLSKGLEPTGKFGIGFFSVFMLGNLVRVTSRRFDAALESTRTLEFRAGLQIRPILRSASGDEMLQTGGTRISVRLMKDPFSKGGWLVEEHWATKEISRKSFAPVLAALAPAIDANIVLQEGTLLPCVSANDWLSVDGAVLIERLKGSQDPKFPLHLKSPSEESSRYGNHMRVISDPNGKIYGRACIYPSRYTWISSGYITVGGFAAHGLTGVAGILLGETETATRDKAIPLVPSALFSHWANEQALLISQSKIDAADQLIAAGIVLKCGGDPSSLPLLTRGQKYLNASEFTKEIVQADALYVFAGDLDYDVDRDRCHPKEFSEDLKYYEEIFFVPEDRPAILNTNTGKWPEFLIESLDPPRPTSYLDFLRQLISKIWNCGIEEARQSEVVAFVNDHEITRDVLVIYRSS